MTEEKKGLMGIKITNQHLMIIVIGLFQLIFLCIYNQLPRVDINTIPGEYVTIYFVALWGVFNTFMIFFYAIVKKISDINNNS